MSKTFEEWLRSLDAKPGDKVVTDAGELAACLFRSDPSKVMWFTIDREWRKEVYTQATRAAFWKRQASGLDCDGKLATPTNVQFQQEIQMESYIKVSTWTKAEAKDEVEEMLKRIPSNDRYIAAWLDIVRAIERRILKKLEERSK